MKAILAQMIYVCAIEKEKRIHSERTEDERIALPVDQNDLETFVSTCLAASIWSQNVGF